MLVLAGAARNRDPASTNESGANQRAAGRRDKFKDIKGQSSYLANFYSLPNFETASRIER